MSLTPFIVFSTDALKHISKKGSVIIISKHRSAGRYGYSGDKIEVICEAPSNVTNYICVNQDGITIYMNKQLSLENYEQLNIWMKTQFGILKKITARVTLYRRLIP